MQRLATLIALLLPLFGCDPARAPWVQTPGSTGAEFRRLGATLGDGAAWLACLVDPRDPAGAIPERTRCAGPVRPTAPSKDTSTVGRRG